MCACAYVMETSGHMNTLNICLLISCRRKMRNEFLFQWKNKSKQKLLEACKDREMKIDRYKIQ